MVFYLPIRAYREACVIAIAASFLFALLTVGLQHLSQLGALFAWQVIHQENGFIHFYVVLAGKMPSRPAEFPNKQAPGPERDFGDDAVFGPQILAEDALEFFFAHRGAVIAQDFVAPLGRIRECGRFVDFAGGEMRKQRACGIEGAARGAGLYQMMLRLIRMRR